MVIKRHISGICVAYPEDCGSGSGKLVHGLAEGREQGSHYNQQKRRIADAVTHLQQSAREDCKPLIFVATSPGFVEHSNEPRFMPLATNDTTTLVLGPDKFSLAEKAGAVLFSVFVIYAIENNKDAP